MVIDESEIKNSTSFQFRIIFVKPGDQIQGKQFKSYGSRHSPIEPIASVFDKVPITRKVSRSSNNRGRSTGSKGHHSVNMELMKERFAKLLLGEDMSGGGKGVSSALALSNAITNLAASVFGEQKKLEPMCPDTKTRWKNEIDWLLSVTHHIVEFVPSEQRAKDGTKMEIMVTQQRRDLLVNIPGLRKLDAMLIDCLDNFDDQNEFWYVTSDEDESQKSNDKWWLPTVKVHTNGLSEVTRKWLIFQRESVNQVLKAAMAINAEVLSEMEIPENYIESLPKNGRSSLGDSMYKSITVEYFNPERFLSTIDLSTEHKVLDLKNRIEASIVIWKRKMNQKDGKSSWGSTISSEKREIFEERLETTLVLLKQQFPGIPQSTLDISKIQYNRDVGHSILESYSRVLESLANTVMSRIEEVLHAHTLARDKSSLDIEENSPIERPGPGDGETPKSMTLSDFIGWTLEKGEKVIKNSNLADNKDDIIDEYDMLSKPLRIKKLSYIDKLEALGAIRTPTRY